MYSITKSRILIIVEFLLAKKISSIRKYRRHCTPILAGFHRRQHLRLLDPQILAEWLGVQECRKEGKKKDTV